MKHLAVLTVLAALLSACSTPESTARHRSTCEAYGYEPGTPEIATCIETRAKQGEEAATKVGTSVLTSAILGAI